MNLLTRCKKELPMYDWNIDGDENVYIEYGSKQNRIYIDEVGPKYQAELDVVGVEDSVLLSDRCNSVQEAMQGLLENLRELCNVPATVLPMKKAPRTTSRKVLQSSSPATQRVELDQMILTTVVSE